MRAKIIAGNWKMNKDLGESIQLVTELKEALGSKNPAVEVVVCPPFTALAVVANLVKGSRIKLGAQNMSEHNDGAYTGEVSWRMLKSVGCSHVILGHSERRQFFHETNELINLKTKKALANDLRPIVCVGETLEEREKGVTNDIITHQVGGVLDGISSTDMERVVVAYEPVWAIGTGRNATPLQAQEVHQLIRKVMGQMFGWVVADRVPVQYGGSVKPENAADILAQSDIDGALVGGASLTKDAFTSIVAAVRS